MSLALLSFFFYSKAVILFTKEREGFTLKEKWYLKTWFICSLFACWFLLGIPLIIGIILLKQKKEVEKEANNRTNQLISENRQLSAMLTPEMKDAIELQKHIENLQQKEIILRRNFDELNKKYLELMKEVGIKREQIVSLDEEILVQEFG